MKKLLVLFLVVAGVSVMLSGCGKKDVKKSKKSLASTVAIDFIRQAAEQGDAKSQYDLGSCYANGIGVEKNQLEAFNWWYKAAMQNYAQAQYEIGSCYEKGFGTVIFTPMAVYWYTQAAVQGHIKAQYQLGKCRTDGVGVAKSEYKALTGTHLLHCRAVPLQWQKSARFSPGAKLTAPKILTIKK